MSQLETDFVLLVQRVGLCDYYGQLVERNGFLGAQIKINRLIDKAFKALCNYCFLFIFFNLEEIVGSTGKVLI